MMWPRGERGSKLLVIALLFLFSVVTAKIIAMWSAAEHRAYPGFSGLEFAPLTRAAEARAPYLGKGGALIASVIPKSPAAVAHLKAGDIVTAIDGRRVDSAPGAVDLLRHKKAGERVTIAYFDLVRGDGKTRTAIFSIAGSPPANTTVLTVEPPRMLAREWDFRPAMAAGASWSTGIARGPVEPLPLELYGRGRCSGLAPHAWRISDAAGDGTAFALLSDALRMRSAFAITIAYMRSQVLAAVETAIAKLARIKPQMSPPITTDDGDQVVDFGSLSGYAGFAIYHVRPTFARGLIISIWMAVVPASAMSELTPIAGAVALSIRCNSRLADPQHRPYDNSIAPTSVSVRCLRNDCDEADFAGAYNAQMHTGYVHNEHAENFLINTRKDIWATGPAGPGTYHQVSGQLEKLEYGRTN